MKNKFTTEYCIGDSAEIKDINVKVKIDGILFDSNGTQYRCIYWLNGDRKSTWCYDLELTANQQGKVGFIG